MMMTMMKMAALSHSASSNPVRGIRIVPTNPYATARSLYFPFPQPDRTRLQFLGVPHHNSSPSNRLIFAAPTSDSDFSQRSTKRGMAIAAAAAQATCTEFPFLRSLLTAMVKPYLNKNPTAAAALDLIRAHDGGPICYDHFAFRTFGVDGCGINSIAQVFLDMGYETREELRFPAKKLRALWFSPPDLLLESNGEEVNGPLPRIFISELLVDQLSTEAQAVIKKYTQNGAQGAKHAAAASVLNCLTWQTPQLGDYQCLARESEYAAWTLVNGYALNHLTVSVHRLSSNVQKIERLNQLLQDNGIRLNSEGGVLKVSPDGGLQQSSTVADSLSFRFAGDERKTVTASYIEFAERLVLPKYAGLPAGKIQEWHRRDGFEVGNADKIFESTSSDQTGVRLA